MQIDPKDYSSAQIYHLMTSVIVPRPIAWVSTLSKDGVPNLAPFSYFSGITSKPPLVSIAAGRRHDTGQFREPQHRRRDAGRDLVDRRRHRFERAAIDRRCER